MKTLAPVAAVNAFLTDGRSRPSVAVFLLPDVPEWQQRRTLFFGPVARLPFHTASVDSRHRRRSIPTTVKRLMSLTLLTIISLEEDGRGSGMEVLRTRPD